MATDGSQDTFRVGTWNIGGLTFLRDLKKSRDVLNEEIAVLCLNESEGLDVLLLQELTSEDGEPILQPPKGYRLGREIVIDSKHHAHPRKWRELLRKQKRPTTVLSQGNAILWKTGLEHGSLWEPDVSHTSKELKPEIVRLDTGIYTGSRDSEPRIAMVTRFRKAGRHIIVVNLHLTTLEHEREGTVERDAAGSAVRTRQVRLVLDGIVSTYNAWWRESGYSARLGEPIWILGGDLNGIPESDEVTMLTRARFFDLCRAKEFGTKRKHNGARAELTLDYLFAGVVHHGISEHVAPMMNVPPLYAFRSSDHYPIFSEIEIAPPPNGHGSSKPTRARSDKRGAKARR